MAALRGPTLVVIVGMVLLAGTDAHGVPPVPGAPTVAIPGEAGEGLRIVVDRFELEPIRAEELAGGSALPQTGARMVASSDGGGLRANGGLQVAPLRTTIERELASVWEYRRRVDAAGSAMPQVRVELAGAGGRNRLVPAKGGDAIPVRARSSRVIRRVDGNGLEVFTGGVILEIPVQALEQPGRYHGRLWITVEAI